MSKHNLKYFAADEAEETVSYLELKSTQWFNTLVQNDYLDKIKRSWQSYHGAYYTEGGNSHEIQFAGEQGELVNLAVNHYRNIAQNMLTMVTSTRPSFQARSVNTDYRSQVQTMLANGLLDYYMREKRLEKYLKRAVEYAIVLGSGYVKMEWDATTGEIYDYIDPSEMEDYDPEMELEEGEEDREPYPVYEGDVVFTNLSPFDIVFDTSKEDPDQHDWVLCRNWKNKFDIAAKYPEFEDEIVDLDTKSDHTRSRITLQQLDETVDIPVYEFFHKRTPSMPEGRYVLYLTSEIILMDTAMPYGDLPVYRIAPSDILGTPYGYTTMFDLLPIQESVNSLHSIILTNQNAFGVQSVISPRGSDVSVSQIEGGMNFIEYNQQAGKPEPLQLTSTPPEVFSYMQQLISEMETISGVNSVVRGNPEKNMRSGNALALVQSQALQFMSGLQQSYIQLVEDVGTGLINMLKDFAQVPRIANISGNSNRSYMKEFTGDDLNSINRVIVDVGNSLANTTAGRMEIASNLLQMGAIVNPEQYYSVLNTGKLETMTEGINKQLLLIKAENEKLVAGESVKAIATENHMLHIKEHQNVLADPDLKMDAELASRVLEHIQEHITLLRETDPDLLAILGQQALGPVGGSPINPPGQENIPKDPLDQVNDLVANPQAMNPALGNNMGPLPQPAQPPQGAVGPGGGPLPTSAEEAFANQAGGPPSPAGPVGPGTGGQ